MNLKIRNATNGRVHRSFDLGSTPTIGVDPGEPFDLLFTNSDPNDIEIRVTLDGIDILTGKPADLSATGERFLVHGYETMVLSAWPESMQGGARFVFAEAAVGVARHTIGEDKAHVGIIAVAVFREGARHEPAPVYRSVTRGMGWLESFGERGFIEKGLGDVMRGGSAVGAGQHVGQQLVHARGLREPKLHMTLVLKHMWNDDLQGLVREQYTRRHIGFPGETKFPGVNLSNVPRVGGYPEPGFGQYE